MKTCIDPFPERHRYKALFENNAPQLYEKRWGSLDMCARYLHRVAIPFLICWDVKLFNKGGSGDEKGPEDVKINVALVDKASRHARF